MVYFILPFLGLGPYLSVRGDPSFVDRDPSPASFGVFTSLACAVPDHVRRDIESFIPLAKEFSSYYPCSHSCLILEE